MPSREKKELTSREKAFQILSRRAVSAVELQKKLRMAGFEAPDVAETVEYCRSKGFLDDSAYAEGYAQTLSGRKYGTNRIRMQLKMKGISGENLENALQSLEATEEQRARESLEYKLRLLTNESDPRRKKEKCFRFLVSRGFSIDLITDLLGEL